MAIAPITFWRRHLRFRLVSTTIVISLGLLGAVGSLLINNVTSGLLKAKEQSVLTEATSAQAEVQRLLNAADTGLATPNVTRLVDSAITALAVRSGAPGIYDALLLSSPTIAGAPERGTALIDTTSVPESLREAVSSEQRQAWVYSEIVYEDGRTVPGMVVGAPLAIPQVGQYELYLLFPLTTEEESISVVTQSVTITGIILLLTLVILVWFITSRVTEPVREAARVASHLAAGELDRRLDVEGEDDLATLATAFNEMAESLQEQIVRLETLSLIQQQFVSDVSHELRTPLTTVRMASEMIYDSRDSLEPDIARAAELLRNQVDRFDLMLSDLLEISRIDAGAALLELGPVDVNMLIETLTGEYAEIATRHNTQIRTCLPNETVVAELDSRRIARILRNLVANAIEHSEGKPIDVTAVANESVLAISVRDYGQGMSQDEVDRVFDRFWRADPSRKRTLGGTGLGLAISADDARLHGGEITLWSMRGRGANFVLNVPLVPEFDISNPAMQAGERRA